MGKRLKKSYDEYKWVHDEPYSFIRFRKELSTSSVFGLEIVTEKLSQHLDKEPINSLKEIGFKNFILLKRLNLLSRLVSSLTAEKIGKWNTRKDIDTPKVKVPYNKARLIKGFEKYESFYKEIEQRAHSEESIVLTYEKDVKKNPKKAYKKICEFLNIKKVNVSNKTKKLNDKHISERIKNIKEVRKMLENTKYEWMLHKS